MRSRIGGVTAEITSRAPLTRRIPADHRRTRRLSGAETMVVFRVGRFDVRIPCPEDGPCPTRRPFLDRRPSAALHRGGARAGGGRHRPRRAAVHQRPLRRLPGELRDGAGQEARAPAPWEIAEAVRDELDLGAVADVEVAGPGFLNLTLDRGWLAANVGVLVGDPLLGVSPAVEPQRVVVDYSAPNIAKEMHVGHLRSTIIGDALARVLSARGHDVIRQNHVGDWGTPFGMLIEHLVDLGSDGLHSLADLTAFYQEARKSFDGDPLFADRSRQRVVLLQAGDAPTLDLWRTIVAASEEHFNAIYAKLGVLLTDEDLVGESFYNDRLEAVCADLSAQGLAVVDDGALCVFPPGFSGRDGQPQPLIIRKSDGGYGYAATDLAALRYRAGDPGVLGGPWGGGLGAGRLIYVVDAGQHQHLSMVFAVAAMAGWLGSAQAEHVGFGIVLGEDGQRLKTRSGDSPKLIDLLDEAVERADAAVTAKNPSLPCPRFGSRWRRRWGSAQSSTPTCPTTESRTTRSTGIGCWRSKATPRRICSTRMCGCSPSSGGASSIPIGPHDAGAGTGRVTRGAGSGFGLVGWFDSAVLTVEESLEPHRLCTYLFELAQVYTAFFENCPVLRADTPELQRSRLVMCKGADRPHSANGAGTARDQNGRADVRGGARRGPGPSRSVVLVELGGQSALR